MIRKIVNAALFALPAIGFAAPANATDTFAQFVQTLSSARIFTYDNVGSGGIEAKLGTLTGSDTVVVSDLGLLASPSIATVSLVGTATALPTIGATISQLFSGSMTFTLLAPQIGMSGPSTNALTVTFVDAVLLVAPGSSAPTLQANSGAGSIISYSSDFLDLSGMLSQDFSLSFSGSSVPLTVVGSRLPDYRVSGSGTFAATTAVPEPASWALMLGGFGLVGGAMRRRRTTAIVFG